MKPLTICIKICMDGEGDYDIEKKKGHMEMMADEVQIEDVAKNLSSEKGRPSVPDKDEESKDYPKKR